MRHNATIIQVFVSCPGDVEAEKTIVKEVCNRLTNLYSKSDCNIVFVVEDWKNLTGEFGVRPQSIINDAFSTYDVYLGILWMRFGTPPGAIDPITGKDYGSGTEEEFKIAFGRLKNESMPPLLYLFFKEPIATKNTQEIQQLLQVFNFKDEVKHQGWVTDYHGELDFNNRIYDKLSEMALSLCLKNMTSIRNDAIINVAEQNPGLDAFEFIKDIAKVQLKDYLPRTFTSLKTANTQIQYNFFGDSINKYDIKNLLLINKRIVLLGTAGAGKTLALMNLAVDAADMQSPFIPIFKQLNTYVDQNIEDFLPPNWNEIPANVLLLIFDGLDEIEPKNLNTAIKKLLNFVARNEEIHVIVSCRLNIFDLPTNTFPGMLPGFEIYFINQLDSKSVINYANREFKVNGDVFLQEAYSNGYFDLVFKPFFLNILLRFYVEGLTLQGGRNHIFESFINKRIEQDGQHYSTTIPILESRKRLVLALQRISLIMESAGKNLITFADLTEIVTDPPILDLVLYSGIFLKKNESTNIWGFEHHNIQEYLAATTLANQHFENIKKITSFSYEGLKIKPTWINTLSFLISILKDQTTIDNLINWIIQIEPEILVKFEPDRISEELRVRVLKLIFEEAKEKNIWTRSNSFDERELSIFSESAKSFDYLFSQLNDKSNGRIVKINALSILRNFRLNVGQRHLLQTLVFELFGEFDLDYGFIHSAIYSLKSIFSDDEELIQKVFNRFEKYTNQYVRSALYSLLKDSKFVYKYVDYLIQGILLEVDNKRLGLHEIKLADEAWNLKEALKNVKEPTAIVTIIQFFTAPEGMRQINYYHRLEVVKGIIENAKYAFRQQPSLYEIVLQLYLKVAKYHEDQYLEVVSSFFIDTGTSLEMFKYLLSYEGLSQYEISSLISRLIDYPAIDYILEQYRDHNITNDKIKELFNDYVFHSRRFRNNDLIENFKGLIISETGVVLDFPDAIDYALQNRLTDQKNFDLLFLANDFKLKVMGVFEKLGKEEVTFNEIWDYGNRDPYSSDPIGEKAVLEFITEFIRNYHSVSLKQLIEWMNNEQQLLDYRISQIYKELKGNEVLKISEGQIAFLNIWTATRISEIDLPKDIESISEENSYQVDGRISFLWYFIRRFRFKVPEDKLLDFTLFIDFETRSTGTGISTLEEFIVPKKIKERVINNIFKNYMSSIVWKSNAEYAILTHLEITFDMIINELANKGRTIHYRREVAKIFFDYVKDFDLMIKLLNLLENDELIWDILETILEYKERGSAINIFLRDYLKQIMKRAELPIVERLKSAKYLTLLGDVSGFEYYADHLLRIKDHKFEFHSIYFISAISDVKALDKLFELLELSKSPDFLIDRFNRLEELIFTAIYNIAYTSETNLKLVSNTLLKFIERNSEIPDINFMYGHIKRMNYNFYLRKSESISIHDAIYEADLILA